MFHARAISRISLMRIMLKVCSDSPLTCLFEVTELQTSRQNLHSIHLLTIPSCCFYSLSNRRSHPSPGGLPNSLLPPPKQQYRPLLLQSRPAHLPPRNRRPAPNRQLHFQPTPLPLSRCPLRNPHPQLPQHLRRRRYRRRRRRALRSIKAATRRRESRW